MKYNVSQFEEGCGGKNQTALTAFLSIRVMIYNVSTTGKQLRMGQQFVLPPGPFSQAHGPKANSTI